MRKDIREKIQKALRVSDDNVKMASREVLELCLRDHDFLLGITEPFLRGIIGHAVKDTTSGKEGVTKPKILDVEKHTNETGLAADVIQTALGGRDGSHKFGTADRTRGTLGKKTKASAKHVDALKAIAKSQAEKD